MTLIGFRAAGALVPPALPRTPERADGRVVDLTARRAVPPPTASWVRVGKVSPRAAVRYLVVWSGVLFVAQLLVLVVTYAVLSSLGVIGSVSRALALVSDQPLPASGVLPALQPLHVLPVLVVVSLVLSLLFLVAAVGVVLVHNATTTLTGGLAVRVRPEPPRRSIRSA